MPIHIRRMKRDLFLCRNDCAKPPLQPESKVATLLTSVSPERRSSHDDPGGMPRKKARLGDDSRHLKPFNARSLLGKEAREVVRREDELADLSWLLNFRTASVFGEMNNIDGIDNSHVPNQESIVYLPSRKGSALKPGLTYTELIERALRENGELTVSGIYKWIYSNFPYYDKDDGRWKNSVRHNLSINPQFRKGNKSRSGGSGHFWTLNKEYDEQFKKWQEWKHLSGKDDRIKDRSLREDEEKELIAATKSILEIEDDENVSISSGETDPNLLRVANEILNGIEREVEVQYMDKDSSPSSTVIIDDGCLEASDCILSDSLLFSDALELGFQPYELINPRL